jgi:hypothetical protein
VVAPFEILEFSENFEIFKFLPPLIYVKGNFQKVRLVANENVVPGQFPKGQTCFRPEKCSARWREANWRVFGRPSGDLENFWVKILKFLKNFFRPKIDWKTMKKQSTGYGDLAF